MGKKLHVGNIPSSATEQDLSIMFGRFGLVDATVIIRDQNTGASKGFGFVDMANSMDADTAISRLNFSQYRGLTMGVSEAQKIPNSIT